MTTCLIHTESECISKMVFSSAAFLFVFFPIVFVLYKLMPTIQSKNILLTLASLCFYSFGQLEYLLLLICSVVFNYIAGMLLSKSSGNRRLILAVTVIANLLLLGTFKYLGFLISNMNVIFNLNIKEVAIELPIGISFFTFQGLSYVIDTYRNKDNGTKDFLKLLLYISLFPQLIAGPIIIYHDVAAQIDNRICTTDLTAKGLRRFIIGLSKKLLIANAMGNVADVAFSIENTGIDTRMAWVGALCYALQIYFDFSGYSDMAIGLGKIFGFSFAENFAYPYTASTMKTFWHRWHISLSTWFRDYLYIPLGGNKKGKLRTELNKCIVFFFTGLWHGASWSFVVWGMWHGLFLILEDLNIVPTNKIKNNILGNIYTLLVVISGFVIFRATDMLQVAAMFKVMFVSFSLNPISQRAFYSIFNEYNIFIFIIAIIASTRILPFLSIALSKKSDKLIGFWDSATYVGVIVLFFFSLLNIASSTFNPFIYFQF